MSGWLGYVWGGRLFNLEYSWAYYTETASKVESIQFYGDRNQYITFDFEEGASQSGRYVSVATRYAVTVDYVERQDFFGHTEKAFIDPGESVTVHLYDLDDGGKHVRDIDILPILKQEGLDSYISSVTATTYQGKDYLILMGNMGLFQRLYDIDAEEVTELPEDLDYDGLGRKVFLASIYTDMGFIIEDEYGIKISQNNIYGIDEVKRLNYTNLSQEEPTIQKVLELGKELYIRQGMVSDEERFNTLIHWFAPKGQEVMELYATDGDTGEKTLIQSYADFVAWADAHMAD
ncbi:hypothetical protein ACEE42_04710 [Streptococcus suis]